MLSLVLIGILTIAIMAIVGFSFASAVYDGDLINNGKYIKSHVSRSILRAGFFGIASLICYWLFIDSGSSAIFALLGAVNMWLIQAFIFWIVFEFILNYETAKDDIFYIGETAILDKVARNIFKDGLNYFVFKCIVLLSAIILFIVLVIIAAIK